VPSRGLQSEVRLSHLFDGPNLDIDGESIEVDPYLTQFAASGNQFWSLSPRGRLFVTGGIGTSFDRDPLPTAKFALGAPFRLGAYDAGELRGSHYYALSGGYLRRVGRLPDFLGGPAFVGGWLENADAFDDWADAHWRVNGGVGLVMDTLLGPVILAGSWSFDGRWRTYLGVGRAFR
jgi:NTE family protein